MTRKRRIMMLSWLASTVITDPGDPDAPISARYWRINILSNNSAGDLTPLVGVKFKDGDGNELTGSGVASAKDSYSGFPAANAINNWTSDSAGYWSSNTNAPSWWQYDFGTAVTPAKLMITGVRLATRMLKTFQIQYSNDGTTFTTLVQPADQTGWALGGTDVRTFNIQDVAATNPGGGSSDLPHRYWRLRPLSYSGQTYYGWSGIGLMQDGEIVTQTHAVTVTASIAVQAGSLTEILNYTSNTLVQFQGLPAWLEFDFGAGNAYAIDQFFIYSNKDDATRTPTVHILEWSDDNTTWTSYAGGFGAPAVGVRKDFIIPAVGNYKEWGFADMISVDGTPSIGELELRAVVGGPDMTVPTDTAFASSVYSGLPASNVINNVETDLWSANGSGHGTYFQLSTAASFQLAELMVESRGDTNGYWQQTPNKMEVFGGVTKDSYRWLGTWNVANYTAWKQKQTQAFTVADPGTGTGGGYDPTSPVVVSSAIASGYYNTLEKPENAFDGSTSTLWESALAPLASGGCYLGAHMANAVWIKGVSFTLDLSYENDERVLSANIQYSDDGGTWTTAWTPTIDAWVGTTGFQTQIWNNPDQADHTGHLYWRVQFLSSADGNYAHCTELVFSKTALGGTASVALADPDPFRYYKLDFGVMTVDDYKIVSEWKLLENVADTFTAGGATVTASSTTGNPAETADKAFDGDPGTNWVTMSNDMHPVLLVDFGAPKTIRAMGFRLITTTANLIVLASNDNSTWTPFFNPTKSTVFRNNRKFQIRPTHYRISITNTQADAYLDIAELKVSDSADVNMLTDKGNLFPNQFQNDQDSGTEAWPNMIDGDTTSYGTFSPSDASGGFFIYFSVPRTPKKIVVTASGNIQRAIKTWRVEKTTDYGQTWSTLVPDQTEASWTAGEVRTRLLP